MNFENPKLSELGQRMTIKDIEGELWRLLFVFCKSVLGATAAIFQINVIVFYFVFQNLAIAAFKFSQFVIDWNPQKPPIFGGGEMNERKVQA